MSTSEKMKLPKLPHGEGTMSYDYKGDIVYKKWIQLPDGSKYRRTITAPTIVDCLKKMMEEEERASHDKVIGRNASRLDHEMLYWLYNVKKNTLKIQSWERLDNTIRNHIIPSPIGNKEVTNITTKDIQKLINDMNYGDYSFSSIKKTYDCLNDFFRYISRRDDIKNPMLSVACVMRANVVKEAKEVEYLDEEDIPKFRAQALSTWESSCRPRYRYGPVLVANLYMGLRIGELLALRWNDVDFERGYIVVNKTLIQQKNPKYDESKPATMKKKESKRTSSVFRNQRRPTETGKSLSIKLQQNILSFIMRTLNSIITMILS